ncbi:hypothetical protein BGZ76_002100 [Entomortierella beljakovae]|nr:hypothetical protein BGZ76_002100 [Entomortierella beljakovae]
MTFDKIKNDDQRKIVLAAKKGSGKSTIANMLVQGNILANNRMTLGGSLSLDLRVDVLDGREWSVCDITGLGFLGEPDSKAWIAAQMMLNQVCGEGGKGREGFDIICFVIEKEMAAKKNEVTNMLWNNFISLFGGAEKCFAVIITHFDIDEPPSVWLKENKPALKSIYGEVSFITTDFTFIPEDPNLHFDNRATALRLFESKL